MAKKRVTNHTGRVSKKTGKPYSPKHNDRDFDTENAKNIIEERTSENINWRWTDELTQVQKDRISLAVGKCVSEMKNEDVEQLFYELNYSEWLADQNEKHIKSRHTERIKTMEQIRTNKNYCPEEDDLQIGKLSDERTDPEIHDKCIEEYIRFLNEEYGSHLHILDWNTHKDEAGVTHTQVRWVWDYTDENGLLRIGQDKALEALGFDLPIPEGTILKDQDGNILYERDKKGNIKIDKETGTPIPQTAKRSRFNNRKMPFSARNREKWLDICEAHGIDVEREADKEAKYGRDLEEVINENKTIEKKNESLKKEEYSLEEKIQNLEVKETFLNTNISSLEIQKKDLEDDVKRLWEIVDIIDKQTDKKSNDKTTPELLTEEKIKAIKIEEPIVGHRSQILIQKEDFKNLKHTALQVQKLKRSIIKPLQDIIDSLKKKIGDLIEKLKIKDNTIDKQKKEISTLNQQINILKEHSANDSSRATNYQRYTDYCRGICREAGIKILTPNEFIYGHKNDRDQSLGR